jgi:glycerophosphoryl diester phosphodiesterase
MWRFLGITLAGIVFFLSKRVLKAPLPRRRWRLFHLKAAKELDPCIGKSLEGIYRVRHGNELFGGYAVLKWSWIVEEGKKNFYLSVFLEKDSAYFICRAKKFMGRILLSGYWVKQDTSETGEVRLVINRVNGGYRLLHQMSFRKKKVKLRGRIGFNNEYPRKRISLQFERPLPEKPAFHVLAHRGGGRNVDFYPFSENSLEIIRLGALLGATGLEIDVRLTSDKVPILFHDVVLSYRSLDNYFLVEPVNSYTLEQIKKLRLKKGERIPTLREALDTILYETPLELVWLDVKYDGDQQMLIDIQREYLGKATAAGRKLEIFIGIPDTGVLNSFLELADYKNVPSLIELSKDSVHQINGDIWAPKWTERLGNEQIETMQKMGKRVFTWTLDPPDLLEKFLTKGKYDGILTNTPSLLRFYYYTR